MTEGSRPIPVVIIGAGLGGISTAIALQSQLGFYDYEMYEMADGVGGTWRENTYPGCACDVPTHWYSLSTEPNPDWSQMFSGHEEIRVYWEKIALKHNVNPRIRFHSEVLSAAWDDDTQLYTVTIQDVHTKDIHHVRAQIVVSAIGFFNVPKWPEVPGRESFKGISMHARMWDHNVDFSGKKVAVIGNGCSGTQIVPVLSDNPTTQIVQFCRTPSWFLPRPQAFIPGWVKWAFRNIPLTRTLFRWGLATQIEAGYAHWKVGPFTSALRRRREQRCIQRIKKLTPPKYHKNLIPDFPMGCKRIIMDPGYLDSLRRPNIDLEWDPIVQITEHGITTQSGKTHNFDIICYATGFDVANSSSMKVTGIGGRSMGDYFKEHGGPVAYMGTTVPGFPNWFILLGPNTGTGLGSVIYSEEVQINYAIQMIEPVIRGKAKAFTPKVEATDAYNQKIQADLKHTVWTSCASWYHAGDPRRGRIFGTWPATQTYLWWLLRKPIWKDYDTIDGEEWVQSRRRLEVLKGTLEALLLGAGLGAFVLARMGKWADVKHLFANYSRQLFA